MADGQGAEAGGLSAEAIRAGGKRHLRARWVVHVVGPVYDGSGGNRHQLVSCYTNALAVAAGSSRVSDAGLPARTPSPEFFAARQSAQAQLASEDWLKNGTISIGAAGTAVPAGPAGRLAQSSRRRATTSSRNGSRLVSICHFVCRQ